MLFPPKVRDLARLVALLVIAVGCSRKIGDSCSTGTDCKPTGGRVCDTTMPGGYCTIPNCEPDSCPEEAACIAFVVAPSTASACANVSDTRTMRAFCMRSCSSHSDCRSGYGCFDLNKPNNFWGAERIDKASSNGNVCTLDYVALSAIQAELAPELADSRTDYCSASGYAQAGGPNYYAVSPEPWAVVSHAGSAGAAGMASFGATAGTSGAAGAAGAGGVVDVAGGGAIAGDTSDQGAGAAGVAGASE